jgi:hypothetical protein
VKKRVSVQTYNLHYPLESDPVQQPGKPFQSSKSLPRANSVVSREHSCPVIDRIPLLTNQHNNCGFRLPNDLYYFQFCSPPADHEHFTGEFKYGFCQLLFGDFPGVDLFFHFIHLFRFKLVEPLVDIPAILASTALVIVPQAFFISVPLSFVLNQTPPNPRNLLDFRHVMAF